MEISLSATKTVSTSKFAGLSLVQQPKKKKFELGEFLTNPKRHFK